MQIEERKLALSKAIKSLTSLMVVNALLLVCVFGVPSNCAAQDKELPDGVKGDGFVSLFNGKDLAGWRRINTAKSTWSVKDGMLICSGKPIGELRTERMYQNFILEVEWRHMKPRGNAGIFVWADDITAKGVPFHRSIEVQVLENAYGNTRGYTTHGDIFPIHGAKMKPINGRGGSRAFPTENRSRPTPEWNHYRIECVDGKVSLAVNGKVVTRGEECVPRKGYICIESEGGIVHYRNMRIKVLPDSPIDKEMIATAERGFRSLYDGIDFKEWHASEGWKANDWRINHESGKSGSLLSKQSFGNTRVIIDFRSGNDSLEVEFRGQKIKPSAWAGRLLAKGNGWNRMQINCDGGKLTVSINDRTAVGEPIELEPGVTPIRISAKGKLELANIYVRD